jgi:hypothetical protein
MPELRRETGVAVASGHVERQPEQSAVEQQFTTRLRQRPPSLTKQISPADRNVAHDAIAARLARKGDRGGLLVIEPLVKAALRQFDANGACRGRTSLVHVGDSDVAGLSEGGLSHQLLAGIVPCGLLLTDPALRFRRLQHEIYDLGTVALLGPRHQTVMSQRQFDPLVLIDAPVGAQSGDDVFELDEVSVIHTGPCQAGDQRSGRDISRLP